MKYKYIVMCKSILTAVQHERAPRASGLTKGRLPFQTFSPAPGHGLYFPSATSASSNSAFKHSSTSSSSHLGNGTFYHPSSSFIHAAAVAAAAAAVVSHHNPISMPSRTLLFSTPSTGIPEPTRSVSATTILPILETPNPKKEKPEEEEVSTTTNTEQLEFYHPSLLTSTENVYESAAKLLFLSIKWARSVPSFGSVS